MKLAIHKSENSYSEQWIAYCELHKVDFKIVNCYDSNIMDQLEGCGGLMWHHHHNNYKDLLFAKQLLFTCKHVGIKVFPDFETGWHFDDKIGQKYLLEAIKAPLVPTYIFYDINAAYKWVDQTTFPKVFKLRGGAGASNVKLLRDSRMAKTFIKKAFSKGFAPYDKWRGITDRYKKYKAGKLSFYSLLGGIYRAVLPKLFEKMSPYQKGYFYAQEFIPNNDSDIRIIVIGQRAFAVKRMIRKNDFRASGSGLILYDKDLFNEDLIGLAFKTAEDLGAQCVAFDFVFDINNQPLIVEISYGFTAKAYYQCPGYWNRDLSFVYENVTPQEWIIEDFLKRNES